MRRWFASVSLIFASVITVDADEWTDVYAYAHRGFAAEDKHDYENARRNLDTAVQRYPKNDLAYFNRGIFFLGRHEYGLALKDLDKAVSLRPVVWTYARWRGNAYAGLGKYDLALADYNKILSFDPDDQLKAALFNDRAWIEATCPGVRYRNGSQAIKDAEFAVRFGRGYRASYLDTLAAAYAEAGNFDSAIKYEQQAIAAQKHDKLRDPNGPLAGYRQHRPYRVNPHKIE